MADSPESARNLMTIAQHAGFLDDVLEVTEEVT